LKKLAIFIPPVIPVFASKKNSAGAGLQPGPSLYHKDVVSPAAHQNRLTCHKQLIFF
jgi:hypothetical protein